LALHKFFLLKSPICATLDCWFYFADCAGGISDLRSEYLSPLSSEAYASPLSREIL